jgi:dUTP pyrophosphatase
MYKFYLKNTSTYEIVQANTAYQTRNSGGFDIAANEDVLIEPGKVKIIKTGLFVEKVESTTLWTSDMHYIINDSRVRPILDIRPRSGLSSKLILLMNSPGLVDADYKDEIGVILGNFSDQPFQVTVGMRIAQGVASLSYPTNMPTKDVERTGGFGSTGAK